MIWKFSIQVVSSRNKMLPWRLFHFLKLMTQTYWSLAPLHIFEDSGVGSSSKKPCIILLALNPNQQTPALVSSASNIGSPFPPVLPRGSQHKAGEPLHMRQADSRSGHSLSSATGQHWREGAPPACTGWARLWPFTSWCTHGAVAPLSQRLWSCQIWQPSQAGLGWVRMAEWETMWWGGKGHKMGWIKPKSWGWTGRKDLHHRLTQ